MAWMNASKRGERWLPLQESERERERWGWRQKWGQDIGRGVSWCGIHQARMEVYPLSFRCLPPLTSQFPSSPKSQLFLCLFLAENHMIDGMAGCNKKRTRDEDGAGARHAVVDARQGSHCPRSFQETSSSFLRKACWSCRRSRGGSHGQPRNTSGKFSTGG